MTRTHDRLGLVRWKFLNLTIESIGPHKRGGETSGNGLETHGMPRHISIRVTKLCDDHSCFYGNPSYLNHNE